MAQEKMLVVADTPADQDAIGYKEHISGLIEMIKSVESAGSFTIGVYGEWGQGKTSALCQIQKELIGQERDTILTVWFNPWRFTGEKHLIIPFFHTLVAELKKRADELETSWSDEIKKRVWPFLKKLAHVPVALAYGLEFEVNAKVISAKYDVAKTIDKQRKAEDEIDQEEQVKQAPSYKAAMQKYESMYYTLGETLKTAAEELKMKVVVFIDDLDRCLPEQGIELLEGLKVLMDLPGFVFVIGVAREVIERGIQVRYKEFFLENRQDLPIIERDYLDKIVQFPMTLPPAAHDNLKTHLEYLMADLSNVKPFTDTIMKALGDNPRTLKRFINAVSYNTWVAHQKDPNDANFTPELLIKMSLIAFKLPELYRFLGQRPNFLIQFQKSVWECDKAENPEGAEVHIRLKVEPTGLDKYLDARLKEPRTIELMHTILCREKRTIDKQPRQDKGFEDEKDVVKYVSLIIATVSAESESRKPVADQSLADLMASRMVEIPAGSIKIADDAGRTKRVEVRRFLLDKYQVTQSLYQRVMGENPSHFKGDDLPVEQVSWIDAVRFCNKLSDITGLKPVYAINDDKIDIITGTNGYRLPTEAEWEYACKAGTTGDRYGELREISWYRDNSDGVTHPVGLKKPNNWGLYDMIGNVWEWCFDWYEEQYEYRVHRGGCYGDKASPDRAGSWLGSRGGLVGFRCARNY